MHDQGHINTPTDADIINILITKHNKKNKERKEADKNNLLTQVSI